MRTSAIKAELSTQTYLGKAIRENMYGSTLSISLFIAVLPTKVMRAKEEYLKVTGVIQANELQT